MFTLLIVDDNPRDLRFITETIPFKQLGLDLVGTATNGKNALEAIAELKPNVVITDISMPVMNGIELAQTLSKDHPEIMILFMSHYDDFSFAKSAIEFMVHGYILKPINKIEMEAACAKLVERCIEERQKDQLTKNLMKQLESSIPILQQAFLREMLDGTGLDEDMIRERMQLLHMQGADYAKVAVISIIANNTNISDAKQDYLNRLRMVNCLIEQKEAYTAHVVQNANQPFVIVFFTCDDEEMQSLLISYISKAWERLDGVADFGISMFSDKAGDIPLLAKEAQTAANASFYSASSPFIFYPEIAYEESESNAETYDIMKLKDEIDDKIFMGKKSGTDAFIDKYLSGQYDDEMYLKSLSYSILNIIIMMLNQKGLNYPQLGAYTWDTKQLWKRLDSFKNIDELRQWLKDIIYSVQQFIEDKNTSRYAGVVKVIKAEIEKKYGEQISVPDLAAAIYLSPKHANAVFKREEGVTIFDYLTEFRMKKAKLLLKETNLTTQGVAEAVGYSNKSHFSIVFRRSNGMTPGEYRDRAVL